jgi:hypothetical protein
MHAYKSLFLERTGRMIALSKISQITLEGLKQMGEDPSSPFQSMFQSMANHIPALHQNNPSINTPEYKVIAFLDGLTPIATISEVEAYFQDLLIAVLIKNPERISKSTFELKNLLELNSIQDAISLAAKRFASDMLFKKPNDYKKDIMSVLCVGETIFATPWPVIVEAKARRDIGVHNG